MALPENIQRTTIYADREVNEAFRSLIAEQGLGLGVGYCKAMQLYLEAHGKHTPEGRVSQMRTRTDFYAGKAS